MNGLVATDHALDGLAAERLVKTLDADALRHNVRLLRAAADGRGVLAVVKGDAYGMGAVAVSRLLTGADGNGAEVDGLAVDTVAEGADLRSAGITAPILVMDVDVAQNAADCLAADLVPSVAQPEHVDRYAGIARRSGGAETVWLRTNVGFNRFGPREEAGFEALLDHLHRRRGHIRVAALFAHLSSSARDEHETAAQVRTFHRRLARTRACLGADVAGSLAATHGLLHPESLRGSQWVRPGIGLYGLCHPGSAAMPGWEASGFAGLRAAVEVRARVLDVITLGVAEGAGYDRSVTVAAGTRLASVAIGFSRGITAAARDMTGLIHGRRCAMVGRPGMDCTQFDVTGIPNARPGDWMTFIGTSGRMTKTVEDSCAEIGCSHYELLSTIRMPVRVRSGSEFVSMGSERSTPCRIA